MAGPCKSCNGASYDSMVEQAETLHGLQRLYWAVQHDNEHVPVRPDSELVAANFPDPKVTLLSPAFMSPEGIPAGFNNGTTGPTDDATMKHFLRVLAARNDWMTYQDSEFISEDGRALPLVFLSASPQSLAPPRDTSPVKLRIWVQGAVHGNEPAGDESLLALLGKMDANQNWTSSILSTTDIMILPRYNPDGVAYFQRRFASNVDPNRDHIKLKLQQTSDIKKVFSNFSPHVAADMHEFSATAVYGGTYRHGADGLFSAAKNLNIHPAIRSMSETLFAPAIASALSTRGFRWDPYVTGSPDSTPRSNIAFHEARSDAKLGRNAMGLTQCISFLCETRGIGLGPQHFARRTATALIMVEAILQTAADNASEVLHTVTSAIDELVKSNEDMVIADRSTPFTRQFTMVDTSTGLLTQVPVTFISTTPTTSTLTRRRPLAYLIPASHAHLAARLADSGVEVQTLPGSYRSLNSVSTLTITSTTFSDTYYEGIVPVSVTTTTSPATDSMCDVDLAPGSFLVPLRQKNAALATSAIEPEGIDSWVCSNVLPLKVGVGLGEGEGEVYPIYRILRGGEG